MIRAQVEPDQQRELMRMCKSWRVSNQLPAACLERRGYEDVISPTHLLLLEQWSDTAAVGFYFSSEQFCALVGAVKGLGTFVGGRVFQSKVILVGGSK